MCLYFVHLIRWVGCAQFPYIYCIQHRVDHICLKDHCSGHPFISYLDHILSHLYNACLDGSSNFVFFYDIFNKLLYVFILRAPWISWNWGRSHYTASVKRPRVNNRLEVPWPAGHRIVMCSLHEISLWFQCVCLKI